jgi:hypothetical protein
MRYILLLSIGLLTGTFSSFLGLGGGLILIPTLIYVFKMTQHQAQGTSIAVMLPPIGILAFLEYYKMGHIDLKIALFIAIGFTFGGFIGGYIAQCVPDYHLRKIFGVFLLIVAINMILS